MYSFFFLFKAYKYVFYYGQFHYTNLGMVEWPNWVNIITSRPGFYGRIPM